MPKATVPKRGKALSSLMKRVLRKGVTGGYTKMYSRIWSSQQMLSTTPTTPNRPFR